MIDITSKYAEELDKTVAKLCTPGKGILAADESTSTIGRRFEKIKVENVEENRRAYRQLLFQVAKESSKFISGVIMFDETLFQETDDKVPFVKVLQDAGIVPGIKVDEGMFSLPGTKDQVTQGITKLHERCQRYYKQGARFAKWRAAYQISKDQPSTLAIKENARSLALYAAICQANGLVPIVEPEVLVVDGDNDMKTSLQVTELVLTEVFYELHKYGVVLERMLLKPNMILPGAKSGVKATPKEIAAETIKVLKRCVPSAVPGIFFLSGGQTEDEAAENLNEINVQLAGKQPWYLSFSYGRALQESALKAWQGKKENVSKAQEAFLKRAENCSKATLGKLKS